ncbi:hypothetical protein OH77DRAFT_628958 [Trametes cingulata]|nr:hypothetical protein OH77DRAFT_628958 [Trametes cingulata]
MLVLSRLMCAYPTLRHPHPISHPIFPLLHPIHRAPTRGREPAIRTRCDTPSTSYLPLRFMLLLLLPVLYHSQLSSHSVSYILSARDATSHIRTYILICCQCYAPPYVLGYGCFTMVLYVLLVISYVLVTSTILHAWTCASCP